MKQKMGGVEGCLNEVKINCYSVFLPGCGLAGFPQKNLKWRIKSQVNAPLMAHKFRSDATRKVDLKKLVSNFVIENHVHVLQFFLLGNKY